jgi:hypothetical protein
MYMNGRKRLIILGVIIILLLAAVPVLVSATPLSSTDIKLVKFTTQKMGVRFQISGTLTGNGANPVQNTAWAANIAGETVNIYRNAGNSNTWTLINTQKTDKWGGFGLPWTEYKKGPVSYMAVYWGTSTYPGSYDKFTVTIK